MNGFTGLQVRQRALAMALALGGLSIAAQAAPPPVRLAWLRAGELQGAQGKAPGPADARGWRTPLGSAWKLFMHAYLQAQGAQEPAYRCQVGQRLPDEEYCCEPGESVTRDDALARSCGPYFEPKRVGVSAADWSRYWQAQQAPAWLWALPAMQPASEVSVPELLGALAQIAAPERMAARQALSRVALRDEGVLAALGSGPRYKTWSWRLGAERAGGAVGWLLDGSPFWFGAPGTSRTALQANAAWMARQWAVQALPDAAALAGQPCVEVSFFQRYAIRSVRRKDGSAAPSGPMSGPYRVEFASGTQLGFDAVPAFRLQRNDSRLEIHARLPLEDYVARVIDREAQATEAQAARALAVAARSYVLQNAVEARGCRAIADSSQAQRVSPNPPSAGARAAAAFTDGLVLSGAAVRYHGTQAAPGVMAWAEAVADAKSGSAFDAILRKAYPSATFADVSAADDCIALPQAAEWLAQRQPRWRTQLRQQAGFEPLGEGLRVCQLQAGLPHSDQRRLAIHIREWASREGRVTLIHEYLHLAFRHHPSGRDEALIEQLAQRLADS
jgi:uncharacterized protein YfaQ (DUF2300 family)